MRKSTSLISLIVFHSPEEWSFIYIKHMVSCKRLTLNVFISQLMILAYLQNNSNKIFSQNLYTFRMHKVHRAYLLLKTIDSKLGAAKKVVSLFTLDSFNKALYDEVHF